MNIKINLNSAKESFLCHFIILVLSCCDIGVGVLFGLSLEILDKRRQWKPNTRTEEKNERELNFFK